VLVVLGLATGSYSWIWPRDQSEMITLAIIEAETMKIQELHSSDLT